jgi:hypothetical protein
MMTQSGEQVLLVNPQKANLAALRRRGASWFGTIGALSVVNYALIHFHAGIYFIFSLGITSIVTQLSENDRLGFHGSALPFVFTFLAYLGARFLGKMATAGHSWAFVTGMALYALDGMIFAYLKSWPEVAFHAWALFCIYQGLKANQELFRRFPEDPNGSGITTVEP